MEGRKEWKEGNKEEREVDRKNGRKETVRKKGERKRESRCDTLL